jgi:hypothetical protein
MTRGPLTFKETDLMRAIKCAIKAGLQVAGFEITKAGSILVHVGEPANDNAAQLDDDWDKALADEGR